MSKLQAFAYNPTTPVLPSPSGQDDAILEDPATPMARRVPLSDIMSSTPRRQGSSHEVSPDERVVWKISPKRGLEVQFASQESPPGSETRILNLLDDDENKKVKIGDT
jgi:hypothetical protein